MIHPNKSTENFFISCTVSFRAILDQRQVFTTSDENWIAHALYLSVRSCNAMYRVRESNSKLQLFYRMFIKLFCHIFLALGLITCLNGVLKLSLHLPKRFDAFQVLKVIPLKKKEYLKLPKTWSSSWLCYEHYKNAIKNGGHRARFCATWMAIIVNRWPTRFILGTLVIRKGNYHF